MSEMLIFIAVVLLVFAALEVTHRRRGGTWRPGVDTRRDRDRGRLEDELRGVAQRDTDAGSPTVPVHLSAPRAAATDYRALNRIAA